MLHPTPYLLEIPRWILSEAHVDKAPVSVQNEWFDSLRRTRFHALVARTAQVPCEWPIQGKFSIGDHSLKSQPQAVPRGQYHRVLSVCADTREDGDPFHRGEPRDRCGLVSLFPQYLESVPSHVRQWMVSRVRPVVSSSHYGELVRIILRPHSEDDDSLRLRHRVPDLLRPAVHSRTDLDRLDSICLFGRCNPEGSSPPAFARSGKPITKFLLSPVHSLVFLERAMLSAQFKLVSYQR